MEAPDGWEALFAVESAAIAVRNSASESTTAARRVRPKRLGEYFIRFEDCAAPKETCHADFAEIVSGETPIRIRWKCAEPLANEADARVQTSKSIKRKSPDARWLRHGTEKSFS